MKKVYVNPQFVKEKFKIEDIITVSSGGGGTDLREPVPVTLENHEVIWFDKE